MAAVRDVAAAILARKGSMDTFKLQKLVYYCQAWNLVWDGEALFPERIEAWANGPVVPALYQEHRGSFTISAIEGNPDVLTPSQQATVEAVLEAYGRLSGRQLARLTHEEAPWRQARGDLGPGERGSNVIPLESMKEFYSALDSDPAAEDVEDIPPDEDAN